MALFFYMQQTSTEGSALASVSQQQITYVFAQSHFEKFFKHVHSQGKAENEAETLCSTNL